MAEQQLETLYECRNTLAGKWGSLMRVTALISLFVFTFYMVLLNFVDLKVLPLRVHLVWHVAHKPGMWPLVLVAGLLTSLFAAAVMLATLALNVRLRRILIHPDRVRVRVGRSKWDIPFTCITSVETVSFASWPGLGSFWRDLKRQIQMVLLTPRIGHTGYGQTLLPRATWVLLNVQGRRWWRGYFVDVDNPEQFLAVINEALARHRTAQAAAATGSAR